MPEEGHRTSRLEYASHLAQIISAVAVVVSIVYLAQQVRENTAAVGFETGQGLLELQFQQDAWEQDSAHVELMIRGDSLPTSLSPVEWVQYSRRMSLRFNVWALAHTGFRKGTLDADVWAGWDRSYAGSICGPGAQLFWEERAGWWDEEFQRLVEAHAAHC